MSPSRRAWQRHTLLAEMRRALVAGLPLMGAQVLTIGNGLIDSLVAGRLGPAELGAVGLGAGIVFIVTLSSIGLMAGLSPAMANLRGQGRRTEVGILFRQGLWLASVLVVIDLAVLAACRATLPRWGLDEGLVVPLSRYLDSASWSVIGAVLVLAARNLCEATARTRPVLLVQCAALGVNLVADLGLGLGMFGLPRLGIEGIGWSTTIVQSLVCVILFAFLRAPTFERFAPWRTMERPDPARLLPLLAVSAPICLMLLSESGLFVATGVQMGMIGTLETGAHNIAIGTAAACYMLPLGLSFALTARMGTALGRGRSRGVPGRVPASGGAAESAAESKVGAAPGRVAGGAAKEAARGAADTLVLRAASGVLLTFLLAFATSVALVLFREPIAALYTDDAQVRALAAELLVLAAVFQLSDGLQATLIALLRGLQDTRVPMLINAFAYWGIGFGTGYVATYRLGMGASGLWLGLIVALSVAAALQGWRLVVLLRRAKRIEAAGVPEVPAASRTAP